MRLTRVVLCEDCSCVDLPDKNGKCTTCGSTATALLVRMLEGTMQFETPSEDYTVANLERMYTL